MKHHERRRPGPSRPRAPIDSHDADFTNENTDGSDFFRHSGNKKADRKARQLCRQVFRTLTVALAGCGDERLQDLLVLSVDPAPDAGRLLVTVSPGTGSDDVAIADLLERLNRATGRLRAEVAAAIVRKRAPELLFRVMPAKGVSP